MLEVVLNGARGAAVVRDDPLDLLHGDLGPAVAVGECHRGESVMDLPCLQEVLGLRGCKL